jgi:hypothetical protein
MLKLWLEEQSEEENRSNQLLNFQWTYVKGKMSYHLTPGQQIEASVPGGSL